MLLISYPRPSNTQNYAVISMNRPRHCFSYQSIQATHNRITSGVRTNNKARNHSILVVLHESYLMKFYQ
ncbi:uncharacterized protein ARMOST_21218 [Armillaria ostoyae]|uniref:Uncharacterized protein n=1 Tax=Armillaria ostoyae TaxID=47428 RepID=A0A284S9J2_ARMOS|nr:uncharacterized protein ARMOST_21218 [Armillaria ostoyae]